jgi:hypothetical protein
LPQKLIDAGFSKVDAVFSDRNGNSYLFSGKQFIYFGATHRWWSEPQKISEKWDNMPFTKLDAAFTGTDGKTYFFSNKEYIRFSDPDFSKMDSGYPRIIDKFWGNIKNNIVETGQIDAAVRLYWEEKDAGGKTNSKPHTYLFSGDQFFRYTDDQYNYVEEGYPKLIAADLLNEPRFKLLKKDKESLAILKNLTAAFADKRNIYLFDDKQLRVISEYTVKISSDDDKQPQVISESTSKTYSDFPDSTSAIHCAFIDAGAVYTKDANDVWKHITSLEGHVISSPKKPDWFIKVSDKFETGLNAVLKGTDGNTYLFKGNEAHNLLLNKTTPIEKEWGRVFNRIYESGQLDAGLVGRDGKTYLFSHEQFFTYDNNQPLDNPASELPELIEEKWGGLKCVAHAYVLDDKTYLLELADEDGEFRYVCYSSNDYTTPDEGYPQWTDQSFWNIPEEHQEAGFDEVDTLFVDGDKLILIHDGQFLEYNAKQDYWGYPKPLDRLWDTIICDSQVVEELITVFVDKTGNTHCFNHDSFLTIPKNSETLTIHRTRYHWGQLKNVLKDKVDAAVVDQQGITYLFAGDQYVRYSSDDYRYVDKDYPKSIAINLRQEASFKNLPDDFEKTVAKAVKQKQATIINAAIINQRNVYVIIKTTLFVASVEPAANYDLQKLAGGEETFLSAGKIEATVAFTDTSDPSKKTNYTYLFSGKYYIRYSDDQYKYIDSGYPKTIVSGLKDIEEPLMANQDISSNDKLLRQFQDGIDAALTDSKDNTGVYLIKGSTYWYNKDSSTWEKDKNQIKDRWGKTRNNFVDENTIDAAFIDPEGGLVVFKGNQYIRYANPLQEYVDPGYPKALKNNWGNLPTEFENGIDAAFQFEGNIYFVKDEKYVQFINARDENPKIIGPYQFDRRWGKWADYLIADIQMITQFKKLNDTYASGDETLTDILHPKQGNTQLPYLELAEMFNWDINQIKWLKKHNVFNQSLNQFEKRFNIELILRISEFFKIANKMGTEPQALYENVLNKLFVVKKEEV